MAVMALMAVRAVMALMAVLAPFWLSSGFVLAPFWLRSGSVLAAHAFQMPPRCSPDGPDTPQMAPNPTVWVLALESFRS